jgi:hypothetical protein
VSVAFKVLERRLPFLLILDHINFIGEIKLPRKFQYEIPDITDQGWCPRETTDEEDGLVLLSVPPKRFSIPLSLTHLNKSSLLYGGLDLPLENSRSSF